MADLEEVEIQLISGFPNIEFRNVRSLLSPAVDLESFFGSLNERGERRNRHAMVSQQAIVSNVGDYRAYARPATFPMAGESTDMHLQSVGRRSLRTGDALCVTPAEAEADYSRVVIWWHIATSVFQPPPAGGQSRNTEHHDDSAAGLKVLGAFIGERERCGSRGSS